MTPRILRFLKITLSLGLLCILASCTFINNSIKKSTKVAQKILGHKNASTTAIYDDPSEATLSDALSNLDD